MAKDWAAVARLINARLAELEMTQAELAVASGVTSATLRELQNPDTYPPRRRNPRTLAAISQALGLPPNALERALTGAEPGAPQATPRNNELTELRAEVDELRKRVEALERAQRER